MLMIMQLFCVCPAFVLYAACVEKQRDAQRFESTTARVRRGPLSMADDDSEIRDRTTIPFESSLPVLRLSVRSV
uniref:Putative secreted protein n=1 Tax=Anopheles darlingi TaxID=43151 RepID=A0A2M4D892_ANODA